MKALSLLTPREQVEHVVRAAGLAPSVHNTQPWTFTFRDGRLALSADRSRGLAVLDPTGRQLVLSCGSALRHARAAARGLGLTARVQLWPDAQQPDLLALLDLSPGSPASLDEVAMATAILHRHTFRGSFPTGGLPPGLEERLARAAEQEGATLSKPKDLIGLEVLLSRADQEQEHDPAYVAELASWVRRDEQLDGIPLATVTMSAAGSSLRQRDFTGTHPAAGDGSAPPPDHPVVLVLSTLQDDPGSWLAAGQALAAVLLMAAEHDVQAQPLGQVTDAAGHRQRLRSVLGLVGVPQLVLRLGTTREHLDSTPRRALDDLLRDVTA